MVSLPSRPFIDPQRRRSIKSVPLWGAVVLAAGLLAWSGRALLLWKVNYPWALAAAFPAGHLLFGVSQAISKLSLKQGFFACVASVRLLYRPYGGETLLFYGLLSVSEEIVFRALPLSFLDGELWQVACLSVLFALVHQVPVGGRKCSLLLTVDLTLFGLVLGLLFVMTGDLWPLVIVHFVRNGSVGKVFVRAHLLGRPPGCGPGS